MRSLGELSLPSRISANVFMIAFDGTFEGVGTAEAHGGRIYACLDSMLALTQMRLMHIRPMQITRSAHQGTGRKLSTATHRVAMADGTREY